MKRFEGVYIGRISNPMDIRKRLLILVKFGENLGQIVRCVFAADRCALTSGRCGFSVASAHLCSGRCMSCSGRCKLVQWLRDSLERSLHTSQRSLGVFGLFSTTFQERTASSIAVVVGQRSLRHTQRAAGRIECSITPSRLFPII